MTAEYMPRLVDIELEDQLKNVGAINIIGPKWCGKTTTAALQSSSELFMQDPDKAERLMYIANENPSLLLNGDNPRLIDEWQVAPKLWDAVRFSVDQRNQSGLYILTGSVSIDPNSIMHSGVGRFAIIHMRTMSLFESGESTGQVSLGSLFGKDVQVSGESRITVEDVSKILVRGGWPQSVASGKMDNKDVRNYCELLVGSVRSINGKVRDQEKIRKIMKALSRVVGTSATDETILCEISGIDPDSERAGSSRRIMSRQTLTDYLDDLRRIHIIEDSGAWQPKLRSAGAVRCSDTRYLTDPAIAAYFLGASSNDLLMDPNTFGLLFECMVVRDLRVYSQSIGGTVYHYHDKTGLEVDAIVHLWDGRWGAIEVKLGHSKIEDAAKNLKRLRDKVDHEERNKLSFMAVVVPDGYAYTRSDGVHVIPIGCLRN